ncbi:OLC1v1006862C1 [Oldenlandia corymbosa var. corymbosa]|uniref:OLC1v1006862C1 n=1 Tax=Oldenlandia corymbosa var. corymbosa TaxID=529605 RepID=A0AAV1DKD4_OLDCO|nr:OLC1v1006862C1 [Oldenlandia corymbosa var. corymbosa]
MAGKRNAIGTEKDWTRSRKQRTGGEDESIEKQVTRKLLSSLKVDAGMWVDLESLAAEGVDVRDCVDSCNLRDIVTCKELCYDDLVKEFYSNCRSIKRKGKVAVVATVKNVEVIVSADVLKAVFNLVDEGWFVENPSSKAISVQGYNDIEFCGEILQNGCDGRSIKSLATNMKVRPRILHLIIVHILVPKGGSQSEASLFERILLWHIMNGKRVNFGKLIIHTVLNKIEKVDKIKSKKPHLPFGGLLTKIFKYHKVPIDESDRGFPGSVLGPAYLSNIAVEIQGVWILKKFRPIEEEITTQSEDVDEEEDEDFAVEESSSWDAVSVSKELLESIYFKTLNTWAVIDDAPELPHAVNSQLTGLTELERRQWLENLDFMSLHIRSHMMKLSQSHVHNPNIHSHLHSSCARVSASSRTRRSARE